MDGRLIDRLGVVRFAFRWRDRDAHEVSRRWRQVRDRDPLLAADLIRMGNVLTQQPQTVKDGLPVLAETDAVRIAYDAGRRDLAVQLLSMMNLSPLELSKMMEINNADIQ